MRLWIGWNWLRIVSSSELCSIFGSRYRVSYLIRLWFFGKHAVNWEVIVTGSESCPVRGIAINTVEPIGSATTVYYIMHV